MRQKPQILLAIFMLVAALASGCVERRLTVYTEPEGAVVWLNDEEIGTSPVTVSFSWYGDYRVRIRKDGYETLSTNRELEAPMNDYFPFDFLAQLYPDRILDEYEWHFELQELDSPDREELMNQAERLREEL